jgi:hypothetical protein
MCYAAQLAFDSGSDPVYATSWLAGQDGGFGFGPWNFDGTYDSTPPNQQAMDSGLQTGGQGASPHNGVGRAWTMANPNGRARGPANLPQGGTDIARAGRALDNPLEVGQTISVVFDNPSERAFFRGYSIILNTTAANGCFDDDNCSTPAYDPGSVGRAWQLQMFDYNSYCNWQWFTYTDPDPNNDYPLFDTDTAEAGGRLDFTLTSPTTFSWTLTPLAHPELAETRTGTVDSTDPIVWIEFQHFNTDSDFYPTAVTGALETDFYIRSIEITDAAPPGQPGDHNGDGTVDAADYVAWRKIPANFGGNPDGYETWRENFAEGGGGGGSGAVPEPTTFVYLVGGAVGLGSLAVRRSRNG